MLRTHKLVHDRRRPKQELNKADTLQGRRNDRELKELLAEEVAMEAELEELEEAAAREAANPVKAELKAISNELTAVHKEVSSFLDVNSE